MGAKLNNLSKDIVNVLKLLDSQPYLKRLIGFDQKDVNNRQFDDTKSLLMTRLFPYPFDVDATDTSGSSIRVYYNAGEFDKSGKVLQDLELHIDIIVSKDLWLINDGKNSYIRPYEILDRVVDLLDSPASTIGRKKAVGWRHLAVNRKFDAIRIYFEDWKVHTDKLVD